MSLTPLIKTKLSNLSSCQEIKKAIRVKWVFRTKFNLDRFVFKNKARLIVKGYSQVHGIDYGDTFAHIARHDTIRLLLVLT